MRNNLFAVVSCLLLFTTSHGGSTVIDVTYRTFWPETVEELSFINPDNTAAISVDSLVMAYWTPVQDSIGFNASDPASPGSDNILLGHLGSWGESFEIAGHVTNDAIYKYDSSDYAGVDNLADGYVYFAVFDVPYSDYLDTGMPSNFNYAVAPMMSSDPTAPGSFSVSVAVTAPTPPNPDNIGRDAAGFGPYVMIPEPGTLALFIIGSTLFIGLRRRKLAVQGEEWTDVG